MLQVILSSPPSSIRNFQLELKLVSLCPQFPERFPQILASYRARSGAAEPPEAYGRRKRLA
ncbi:hypothetical protein [Alkalilimnicola ehrlichii]|uniref:hypothetical protein n=1 Tax=Alkalilimnicola ehrlichii TaxID=351052 RepID=UPI0015F25A7A|nr:hypothetical protein [Alkalilimnicola ehrlichii]